MKTPDFDEAVEQILQTDRRYDRGAYLLLRDALDHTQQMVDRPAQNEERHVSGQELVEGFRDLALKQFGPMAMDLLDAWGVRRCEDIGELVFALIDHHVLRKTETDSREDFKGAYDFHAAFREPFLPASRKVTPPADTETQNKAPVQQSP